MPFYDLSKYNAVRIHIQASCNYQLSDEYDIADYNYTVDIRGTLKADPRYNGFQASGYLDIVINGYQYHKDCDGHSKSTFVQPADGKVGYRFYQTVSEYEPDEIHLSSAGGDSIDGKPGEVYPYLEVDFYAKDSDGREFSKRFTMSPFELGDESWTYLKLPLNTSPLIKARKECPSREFGDYTPPNLMIVDCEIEFLSSAEEVIIETVIDETTEAFECVTVIYSDSKGAVHEVCTDARGRIAIPFNEKDPITILGIKKDEQHIYGDLLNIKS